MQTHQRRRRAGILAALGICLGMAAAPSCSLLVERRDTQCDRDDDCKVFQNARCDLDQHICIPRADGGPDADGGGDGACIPLGPNATSVEILNNPCTDSKCVPFDDHRLKHLGADGGLLPIPDAGGGG